MRRMRSRPGFTILEVMVAAGLFMVIFMGGFAMLGTSMISFRRTRAQTNSDVDATVLSMQRMIEEVREAKQVILAASNWIQIYYPPVGPDGRYNRLLNGVDPASLVEYYLSDSTGNTGVSGTWLWRRVYGGAKLAVCRNVEALGFTLDSPRSVRVTVRTTHALYAPDATSIVTDNTRPQDYAHTDLVQRVIYLRNYGP
jgi:type II secretory pathway pseudopilin PulG